MSDNSLKMWLAKPETTPFWVIRWVDPETKQTRQKSTGESKKKDAERKLGEFRADLLNSRFVPNTEIAWNAFRLRYETEVLPGLAKKTALKTCTVFNAIERLLKTKKLKEINSERLSYFQAKLRYEGRAESTIAGYLAHLQAALNWAAVIGLLGQAPKVSKPKRAKNSKLMKGRPVTDEEFKAMLKATEGVVGKEAADSWERYLEGLWWSGLRLAESLEVFWDDPAKLCVVFDDDELMLRIPGELEKGNKDRLLPIAPEFAEFLLNVPEADRQGRVFKLKAQKTRGERLTADRVTRIISKIGKATGVIVDSRTGKPATAHDLRRSFGERWARRVMPQVLMELMRHESIETTLRYYVGKNAKRTSRLLREAYEGETKPTNGNHAKPNDDKETKPAGDGPGSDSRDSSRDTIEQEPENDPPPMA